MSHRPRIAILSDKFPPAWGGGVASVHYHLLRWLRKSGFTAEGFSYFDDSPTIPGDGITRQIAPKSLVRFIKRANGLLFRVIEPGRAAYQTSDILQRAWGARRLNHSLARFAPDIAFFPDHGASACWVKTPPGCKRVLATHHNPSRFIDLPTIEPHSRRDIRLAMALEQRSLKNIDLVIPPCRYMRDLFNATHSFNGPVEIAPYLINDDYIEPIRPHDPRSEMGLSADAPVVYAPSGGNKFKGAALLPEILRRLDDAANGRIGFFISGAMPQTTRDALKGLRLYAPGQIKGEEVIATVKSCDFGVFPTLVENYSVALLEAVLCGVPMVAFDVGGNGEIIRHGETGYITPYQDAGAMAEHALRLLNGEHAGAMSSACRKDALARHSEKAVARRWLELLNLGI